MLNEDRMNLIQLSAQIPTPQITHCSVAFQLVSLSEWTQFRVSSCLQGLPSVVYMGCSQPGGLRGGGAKARLLISGVVYGLREE